jgi:hypothetical protein
MSDILLHGAAGSRSSGKFGSCCPGRALLTSMFRPFPCPARRPVAGVRWARFIMDGTVEHTLVLETPDEG